MLKLKCREVSLNSIGRMNRYENAFLWLSDAANKKINNLKTLALTY